MPLRWGLLGCGDIARKRVGQALRDTPGSAFTAACRRDAEALHAFCREFGVPRAYTDAAALIGDPDLDAVYIATPVNLHLPQTLAAAATGKHVLVEKPMARSAAECERMIAACRAAKVHLGVAYYRRFYPVVARLRQILAAGALGRPMAVSAVTSTPFVFSPQAEGTWRALPEQSGGGALMDIGSHRIDLFHDLFGPIAEVHGYCDTLTADYPAEDCATLSVRFASRLHGSLHCFFGSTANRDEFTVIGSRGWLRSDPLNSGRLIGTLDGTVVDEAHPPAENLHAPLIADFVAAVAEGREPRVSGEEGRRTNEVMERAYRSAGIAVPW